MSSRDLKRLLAPETLALFGGAWADTVEAASRSMGFAGTIWRVHPTRQSTSATRYFRSVDELPAAPDAAFIAAPAQEAPRIAASLAQRGCGGFVCFAAGFSETATHEGERLTAALLAGAAGLPFFGPNCYGFLNFFDGAALWPDQVVGGRIDRGVALICQSGTIALNLLFNGRSLPVGYVLTVGNQTGLSVEDLIEVLCGDERVSAFGLYVEGLRDPARFAAAVSQARAVGKPIALVKAGRTEAAARTARTHTGSLAGADSVFDAFCRQSGIARCDSLATLCETLKVLHTGGPLAGRRVLVMGASGGDMAMTADAARQLGLRFEPFPLESVRRLRELLTDKVTIANPFDFHTHVWFDPPAMRTLFDIAHTSGFDLTAFMIDCPPVPASEARAYLAAIDAFLAGFPGLPARAALISSLPESIGAPTRQQCLNAAVVPLQGQREALEALDLAGRIGESWRAGTSIALRIPTGRLAAHWHRSGPERESGRESDSGVRRESGVGGNSGPAREPRIRSLAEDEAKSALAAFGVTIPQSRRATIAQLGHIAGEIGFPVALKAVAAHLDHKSDVGGVILNVRSAPEAETAGERLSSVSGTILIEQMITDGVAEVLVGMTVDSQFGQTLVLGAGGTLTELVRDTVTLLPPFEPSTILAALGQLRIAPLLRGFRGRPAGDVDALVAAIVACTRFAESRIDTLVELEINPVIVRPVGRGAVAVDALVRILEEPQHV